MFTFFSLVQAYVWTKTKGFYPSCTLTFLRLPLATDAANNPLFLGNYDEDWFKSGAMNKYLLLDYALEDPWEAIYFNDR